MARGKSRGKSVSPGSPPSRNGLRSSNNINDELRRAAIDNFARLRDRSLSVAAGKFFFKNFF